MPVGATDDGLAPELPPLGVCPASEADGGDDSGVVFAELETSFPGAPHPATNRRDAATRVLRRLDIPSSVIKS